MSITVEWTIVAKGKDQTADSAAGVIPGWPTERVQLIRRDRTTANLALPSARSTDATLNTTFGDKILDARAKQRVVVLDGLLTAKQYRRLSQFREDSRSVYLSPNFDERTIISLPLFATAKSIAGPDLTYTNTGERFAWDEDRQVIDAIGVSGDPIAFGGPYGRYGRPRNVGTQNRAAVGQPTSVSTGWILGTGSGNISYDDGVLTPLVSRRHTTNSRGTALLDAIVSASQTSFYQPASGLTAGVDIAAVCYVMVETGGVLPSLKKSDASTSDSLSLLTENPGVWQRIEMGGAQLAGGTSARLQLHLIDSGSGGSGSSIRVGPVFIGNVTVGDSVPDWHDTGAAVSTSLLSGSVGGSPSSRGFTLSGMFRIPTAISGSTGSGFMRLGSSGAGAKYLSGTDTFTFDPTGADPLTCTPLTTLSLSSGDWVHMVCTTNDNDIAIWGNGTKLTSRTPADFDGGVIDNFKNAGYGGSTGYVTDSESGICLLRVDNGAWTDVEIQRHYQTFGQEIGQAIVGQVYGRQFEITELSAEQFTMEKAGTLFRCDITLQQVDEGRDFAPVRRTEAWT